MFPISLEVPPLAVPALLYMKSKYLCVADELPNFLLP
jgi:hypothetical protein